MQLTTDRLILREMKLSDIDRFDPMANSDFVLKYLCMYKMDREQSLEYIKQMIEKKHDLAVAFKDTDEIIGKVHFDNDPLRYDVNSVDVAYWLGEEYTGKGYMTEAMTAFIDYLFHEKGYDIITAQALAPNTASQSLLKRLGFTQEGYLRKALKYNDVIYDGVVFSLLKEEFPRED